jgi:hypothetical protein
MLNHCFLLLLLLQVLSAKAYAQQITPFYYDRIPPEEIPVYKLSSEMIKANAPHPDEAEKMLQIGIPVPVSIDLQREGRLIFRQDGSMACLLRIRSEMATHVNLILSGLSHDTSAAAFIYAPGGAGLHRLDVLEGGLGASIPVEGEELILEYNSHNTIMPQLQIDRIIHGIKSFRKVLRDFGESGPCNVNINCPAGQAWSQQASGVVMLLTAGNSRFCSGAMINNTSRDGTPYVLTAAHCEPAPTDLFMFNYQSPGCAETDGPVNQIIQGCTVRAFNPGSDFCLVELRIPPQNFQTYLCGWDQSGDQPSATTVIHHPEGDIKKISTDNDPPDTNPYLGAICWQILGYESGTTESGSSGAPLFNPQKRIVGQLFGGEADCNSNFNDYYGKFSASWSGNTSSERLRDWLDPKRTQSVRIDGTPYQYPRKATDARLVQIKDLPDVLCGNGQFNPQIEVKNMGTAPLNSLVLQYSYSSGAVNTLTLNTAIVPLASTFLSLQAPEEKGEQLLKCWINSIQPGPDSQPANDTLVRSFKVQDGYNFKFSVFTDAFSTETSFRLKDEGGKIRYELQPESLGDEAGFDFYFCLPAGCYTLEINDDGGDGICCSSGNGAYSLHDPYGGIIFSGGAFGSMKEENFCFDSTLSVHAPELKPRVKVYPVPADRLLTLSFDKDISEKQAAIFDFTGRLIKLEMLSGPSPQIDLTPLVNGVYFYKIRGSKEQYEGRFLISR